MLVTGLSPPIFITGRETGEIKRSALDLNWKAWRWKGFHLMTMTKLQRFVWVPYLQKEREKNVSTYLILTCNVRLIMLSG